MSTTLSRACAHLVESGAIDELEKGVEMDAFNAWLVAIETDDDDREARIAYHAKRELLQQMRNLATVSNR